MFGGEGEESLLGSLKSGPNFLFQVSLISVEDFEGDGFSAKIFTSFEK